MDAPNEPNSLEPGWAGDNASAGMQEDNALRRHYEPGGRRESRAERLCYEDASRSILQNEPNPGRVSSLKSQVSSQMNAQNEPKFSND